jgi:threonine synthase
VFDYSGPLIYNPELVELSMPGIWRYRHTFDLAGGVPNVSLGEGNTPLVWGEAFDYKVGFKCEYLNPTGSFKDRGSALLVGFIKSRGGRMVVEDSSGNAGASLAAYAARGGLKARIYMPDSISGPKRCQIETYGAQVTETKGPRWKATEALLSDLEMETDESQLTYASHASLPFNLPGYATIAYEIVEQIGITPGTVIVPVGQGGLLLGIARGFDALQQSGAITSQPELIGVQARLCAPLWAINKFGSAGLSLIAEEETLAEGIRIQKPIRGDTLLKVVNRFGGKFLAVEENEILPGRDQLANRGFYVEPTSAVVWNGIEQIVDGAVEPIIVILTGSGLKSGCSF